MKYSIIQLDPTNLEWGKLCIEFYADLMPELGGGRGGGGWGSEERGLGLVRGLWRVWNGGNPDKGDITQLHRNDTGGVTIDGYTFDV